LVPPAPPPTPPPPPLSQTFFFPPPHHHPTPQPPPTPPPPNTNPPPPPPPPPPPHPTPPPPPPHRQPPPPPPHPPPPPPPSPPPPPPPPPPHPPNHNHCLSKFAPCVKTGLFIYLPHLRTLFFPGLTSTNSNRRYSTARGYKMLPSPGPSPTLFRWGTLAASNHPCRVKNPKTAPRLFLSPEKGQAFFPWVSPVRASFQFFLYPPC